MPVLLDHNSKIECGNRVRGLVCATFCVTFVRGRQINCLNCGVITLIRCCIHTIALKQHLSIQVIRWTHKHNTYYSIIEALNGAKCTRNTHSCTQFRYGPDFFFNEFLYFQMFILLLLFFGSSTRIAAIVCCTITLFLVQTYNVHGRRAICAERYIRAIVR